MKTLSDVEDEINRMIDEARKHYAHREWLYFKEVSVYFRVSNRYHGKCTVRTLEIANVIVKKLERGKGVFTRLLKIVESIARELGWMVLVEEVVEQRLLNFLVRRGYVFRSPHEPCRTVYLMH